MFDMLSLTQIPLHERKILFRGKEIQTADLPDNQGYVALNSLCDAFGLDRRGQRQRLERQGSYFRDYTALVTLSTPGGPQATLCLLAAAVPLFLTGVQLDRVSDPKARDLLRAFLDEALDVLAEHFGISERGEMRFLREAVGRMVAEQEAFDTRIEVMVKKVDAELAEIRQAQEDKVQQIREAFVGLRGENSPYCWAKGPHHSGTAGSAPRDCKYPGGVDARAGGGQSLCRDLWGDFSDDWHCPL